MSISIKDKELAAVGISVAAGCKPCTAYHVNGARKAEATDTEIETAVKDAYRLRVEAAELMQKHGLAKSRKEDTVTCVEKPDRVRELLAVGVAFSVNCTTSLKKHLKAAETVGISAEEISEIVTLARFIKGMAASHVEKLVEALDTETPERDPGASGPRTRAGKTASGCGC